jgi:transmembrane sensor
MNAFFHWLAKGQESESNKFNSKKTKIFNQLKTLWDVSLKTSISETPNPDEEWSKLQHAIAKVETKIKPIRLESKKIILPRYAFAVACVALIAISGFLLYLHSLPIKYSVGKKDHLTVILPDSSKVILNSDSQLTLNRDFPKNSRNVNLTGEAYFSVCRGQPFRIRTDAAIVEVVGTEFNVKSRDNLLEVAVNEGKIKLSSRVDNRDSSVTLTKGQLSTCREGGSPDQPRDIHFDQYPGWLYSKLTLYQTELKSVCQEIERRFDVSIHLFDNQLGETTITGLVEASDLEDLLTSLCGLIEKEYRHENETIIIY